MALLALRIEPIMPFASRQHRPFTSRPFWRDWLVGCVLFGLGWVCYLGSRAVAYLLVVLGTAILLAALAHEIVWMLRARPSE